MFQNSNYSCVHLSDVLNQYYVPEKIDKPELESYITLSSYGKGIKKREIKEGKTPVPFTGCRIKAGQFISSRLHAKEGAFGLVPEELDGFVVSRDFPVFDIDINQINPKYLLAAVSHESFYQQFLNDSFGSTTKRRIKENIFLEYSIVLPPLDKQNEYVSFLEHIGHIRTMLKRYLYLLDSLVKSRFIEMFGTLDLSTQKSEWKEIGLLGKILTGSTPKTNIPDYWDGDIRWITPTELRSESIYIDDTDRKITEVGRKSCSLNILKPGTVLLTSRAPIGKVAIVGTEMYCNQGFKNIECGPELNNIYLYILLKHNTEYLNSLGRGATFKEISAKIVSEIRIPAPPIEVQNRFADFVKQVDKSKFSDGLICSR